MADTVCAYDHGKLLLRGEYMKAVLKQLRQTQANSAVSVFVKTHRTHPENKQDPIALKTN